MREPPNSAPAVGVCRVIGWCALDLYKSRKFSEKVHGMIRKVYMFHLMDRELENNVRSPNLSRCLYECAGQSDGRVRYAAPRSAC